MTEEQRHLTPYPVFSVHAEEARRRGVPLPSSPPLWSIRPRCSTLSRIAAWQVDWKYLPLDRLLALTAEAAVRQAKVEVKETERTEAPQDEKSEAVAMSD
jgi:hypothetical protein